MSYIIWCMYVYVKWSIMEESFICQNGNLSQSLQNGTKDLFLPISQAHFVTVLNFFFALQFSLSSSIHSNSKYNSASHGFNSIEIHSDWKGANSFVVLLAPSDCSFPVPFLSSVDPQFYVTVTISSLLILSAVIISAKLWWDVSTLLCLHGSVIHPLRQLAPLCVWVTEQSVCHNGFTQQISTNFQWRVLLFSKRSLQNC